MAELLAVVGYVRLLCGRDFRRLVGGEEGKEGSLVLSNRFLVSRKCRVLAGDAEVAVCCGGDIQTCVLEFGQQALGGFVSICLFHFNHLYPYFSVPRLLFNEIGMLSFIFGVTIFQERNRGFSHNYLIILYCNLVT